MALHLGILHTDQVREDFQREHGGYPEMFRHLFLAVDPSLTFTDYDVRQQVPADIVCDVYVITGSKHSVYDDLDWIPGLVDYLREVLAAGKKVIGICFGHQLMAHYFGGHVAPSDAGWVVGVHVSDVVQSQPWMHSKSMNSKSMHNDTRTVAMLSSHKDQVLKLPEAAEVFIGSDFCPIGGYTVGDQVITVQGHPEFPKAYARELMTSRRDMIGEPVFSTGLASFRTPLDAELVARWMLEFVRT